MAKLSHKDLFDFDTYNTSIKQVAQATKDFGTTTEEVIKRASTAINELRTSAKGVADSLRNFNIASPNGGAKLDQFNKDVANIVTQIKNYESVQTGLNKANENHQASLKELRAEYKALLKIYEQLDPAQADYSQQVQGIKNRVFQVVPVINTMTQAIKVQKQSIDAAEGSYKRMSLELAEWRAKLQAMPNAYDQFTGSLNKHNKEAVEAATNIQRLDAALKNADAQLGVYSRNVGNYRSGFNGLNNAINQLTREAPAFSVSIQTGMLALSNNLPILADAVTQVQRANKELVAAGEKPKSLFRQIVSSIFSFQTALSAGITLLVVYGKEIGNFVSSLFAGRDAIDKTKEAQEKLNEAMKSTSYTNAITQVQDLTENISLAKQGLLDNRDVLRQYNDTLGKTIGKAQDLGEAEQLLKDKGQEYIQMTLYKAAAQIAAAAAGQKMVDAALEQIELERGIIKNQQELAEARKRNDKEAIGLAQFQLSYFQQKSLQLKEQSDQQVKNLQDISLKFKEQAATIANLFKISFFDNDQSTKEENELKARIAKQQAILKSAFDLNVKNQELSLAQQEINEEQFQKTKLNLSIDYAQRAILLEEQLGKNADVQKINGLRAFISDAKKEYFDHLSEVAKKEDEVNKKLNSKKRGVFDLGDPNVQPQSIADVIVKSLKDAAKASDTYYQGILQNEDRVFAARAAGNRLSFKDRMDHLEKMKKINEDAANAIGVKDLDLRKKYEDAANYYELEKQTQKFGRIVEMVQDSLEIVGGLYQAFADIANQQSDARIANLEKERDKEIEAAGQNAEAKKAIEKRFADQIRAERIKQAKRDKIAALFQAGINAGDAILKTLSTFGPPVPPNFLGIAAMAFTGATIAAQIAAIVSKPLPQFKKGTKSAPKGFALVGEEGFELIQDRGKILPTPDGPSLTYLRGGEKIIPHRESVNMVKEIAKKQEMEKLIHVTHLHGRLMTSVQTGSREARVKELAAAMRQGGISESAMERIMSRAISDIPRDIHSWDDRGYRHAQQRKNELRTYLNQKYGG
jgi:hypothetical protein